MFIHKDMIQLISMIKDKSTASLQDHQAILKAATQHHVIGLIQHSLSTHSSLHIEFINQLKKKHQANLVRTLMQLTCLLKLYKLAAIHQLRMLCIKGVILSYQLYDDIGIRTSNDIDIMVSNTDILKIDAILEQLGFKGQYNLKAMKQKKLQKVLSVVNEMTYYNPETQIVIDVHYQLMHSHIRFYSFEELWEKRQLIKLPNGESVYTLSKEHMWIYLCVHGSSHGFQRLQWLLDIVNYQRKFIENTMSDSIYSIVKKYEITHYYTLALLFIDVYDKKKITINPLYFLYVCKCMQKGVIRSPFFSSVLIRIHYFLMADSHLNRLKLVHQLAWQKFILCHIKTGLPLALFPFYFMYFYFFRIPGLFFSDLIKKVFFYIAFQIKVKWKDI